MDSNYIIQIPQLEKIQFFTNMNKNGLVALSNLTITYVKLLDWKNILSKKN
jgi:hypothetical protein